MAFYLGLDSSTQSLTGLVLEVSGNAKRVVFRRSIEFDAEFPQYGTRTGVLPHDDPLVAASSPILWAEALDRFMQILGSESDFALTGLRAVSGAAQQHGSVYLNAGAAARLRELDPGRPLSVQVGPMLSRPDAPIWMDASTTAECAAITEALGGAAAVRELTGSSACERFTGPQIRKMHDREPAAYRATDRIHLVSSFLASLLTGRHAALDHGDASGMNLMDLGSRRWSEKALRATAPGLARRLPELVAPWSIVGRLAPYWTERHGLPPAKVVAWTGDNPSTAIGVGLVDAATVAVSLGTSDTVFGLLSGARTDPSGAGHVFVAPTGEPMALVCFRNGSLARERVRDACGLDWEGFSRALAETPAGNGGRVMLPWFEPEITPPVLAPGARRYGLDERDGRANVRAVVEGQMLAAARHTAWMGPRAGTIHATGGAARNREILQVVADVFEAEVRPVAAADAAALGAALRAWHADLLDEGEGIGWEEVVAGIARPAPGDVVRPIAAHVEIYRTMARAYAACESHALGEGPDPTPLLEAIRSEIAS